MENHHFSWENSLFLWPCGHVPVRYVTNYQAGYPKILSFWWLMWRSSHNGSKDPPAETPAALAVSKPQKPWKKHIKNMDESKNWGNTKAFLWFSACQIKVDQFWATHVLFEIAMALRPNHTRHSVVSKVSNWRSQSPQFGKGPFQISSCFCSIIISHTKCNRLDI